MAPMKSTEFPDFHRSPPKIKRQYKEDKYYPEDFTNQYTLGAHKNLKAGNEVSNSRGEQMIPS